MDTNTREREPGLISPRNAIEKTKEGIVDHPSSTVLSALAVGAFVGVLAGRSLLNSRQFAARKDRQISERLGEKIIASLDKNLPDSIASTLGLK